MFLLKLILFGFGKRRASGVAGGCKTFQRIGITTSIVPCNSSNLASGIGIFVGKACLDVTRFLCSVHDGVDEDIYLFHTLRALLRYKIVCFMAVSQRVTMVITPF